jgi:hypothetical protein
MVSSLGFLLTGKILVVVLNILYISANMVIDKGSLAEIPGNVINIVFVWFVLGIIDAML